MLEAGLGLGFLRILVRVRVIFVRVRVRVLSNAHVKSAVGLRNESTANNDPNSGQRHRATKVGVG